MSESSNRLHYLYNGFINDTASAEEISEFWLLLNDMPDDHPIKDAVFRVYNETVVPVEVKNWDIADKRLRKHTERDNKKLVAIPFKRRVTWAAAAAIIILLGSVAYFQLFRSIHKIIIRKIRQS